MPEGEVSVETDRKTLIDLLGGLKPSDEHARVRLSVGPKRAVLSDWNGTGKADLPVSHVEGSSDRAFDANRMTSLLRAMPGKKVRLDWDEGRLAPIQVTTEEASNWLTLLSPVL